MSGELVNEEQYVNICNQELRKHPDYEEGMAIISVPPDTSSSNINGYSWEGPDSMPGIVADVINKVNK